MTASLKCNACGRFGADAEPLPGFYMGRKGKNVSAAWFWCKVCGSCFCATDSTEQDEVAHHQTREHGRLARLERYCELTRPMHRHICSEMAKRGLAGANVLDVGASFGGFLKEAQAAGFNPSAIDINPECVDYLRSQGFAAFQASSLTRASAPKASFDAITMLDVSYYFKDQRVEFESARDILRPRGWLVLRTTNKLWAVWLSTVLSRFSAKRAQELFARAVVDHSFVQSASCLKKVLQNCGYSEIVIEPDKTRIVQDVRWDTKAAYAAGVVLSKIARRSVLVPGIIAWARRP